MESERPPALTLLEYERLAEIVAVYADCAGLPLGIYARHYPSLLSCVRSDVRGEMRRLSRWYRATKSTVLHSFAGPEDPDADLLF